MLSGRTNVDFLKLQQILKQKIKLNLHAEPSQNQNPSLKENFCYFFLVLLGSESRRPARRGRLSIFGLPVTMLATRVQDDDVISGRPEFNRACRVVRGRPGAAAATASFPYAGRG